MTTRTYRVSTMSCEHCVSAIEGAVSPLSGVESVDVDLDTKLVEVIGGDDNEIRHAIDGAGYDID